MIRFLSRGATLLAMLALAACSGSEEPTQRVQYGQGLLDMAISQQWMLESADEDERIYVHREHDDFRLHVSGGTQEFGHAMPLTALKTMLGKDLNLAYGGVYSYISFGGNAMFKFVREREDEYDDPIHCEEWVLAKPVGNGDYAQVEISLRMPKGLRVQDEAQQLVDALHKRVGDAKIPRV